MIFAVVAALAFFLLFYLTGRAVLLLLGIDDDSDIALSRVMASGLAVVSVTLFLLCVIRAYYLPGAIAGILLLFFGSLIILRNQFNRLITNPFSGMTKKGWAIGGWLFLCTLPGLTLAPLPPYYKDTLIYHLFIPKVMIASRTFANIPGLSNTHFPLGMELIYGLGEMIALPEISRLIHYGFFWLLIFTAYKAGKRAGRPAGLAAATIIALTPSMQIVATWAYIDIALAFLTLTIFLSICDEKLIGTNRGLAWIGLMIGFALWMKFLSLYLAAYSMVLLLIAISGIEKRPSAMFGKVIFTGAIAGIFASPWYIKNLIQTGNPVYPYFTNLFGGQQFWDDFYGQTYFQLLSGYGHGDGLLRYILAPWYMVRYGTFETTSYDGVIGPVWLVLFLLVAIAFYVGFKKRSTPLKIFSAGIFFGYFLWLTNSQQLRFLLPTLALLPVMAVWTLHEILAHRQDKKIETAIFAALIFTSFFGLPKILSYQKQIAPFAYLAGGETRQEFLMRVEPLHPIYTWINENLPEDSNILLVWMKNKRYYLERKAYSDSIFEHFTLQKAIRERSTADGLARWMKEKDFTHILFDDQYIRRGLEPGELEIFAAYLAVHARLVKKDGYFILVETL